MTRDSIVHKAYKIGIDARFFRKETGGIGRYVRELISHLGQLDPHNEYTVFLTPEDKEEWTFSFPNIHPVVVPAKHFTPEEQTVFLQVLLKANLDLVHFMNFNHPVLYRRPFVTTLHDLTLYFFPAGKSKTSAIRHTVFKYIFTRSLRVAKKVIAVSEYSAKDAEQHLGIPQTKMEVIYHGGPERQELQFGNKALVQEYLGSRDPYFLFVSQWRPHKGIVTLIEAFTLFKAKTGLPHKLVLLGKKTSEELVAEALRACPFIGDIIMPGFAPEELLPSLYHNATVHILPSEYEGFGLTILESYTYGTPVIAADNSSLPEVVGSGGLLFPTKNVRALSECMEKIVTDDVLRKSLAEKGSAHLQKFSWKRAAEQTLSVYMSILEKNR